MLNQETTYTSYCVNGVPEETAADVALIGHTSVVTACYERIVVRLTELIPAPTILPFLQYTYKDFLNIVVLILHLKRSVRNTNQYVNATLSLCLLLACPLTNAQFRFLIASFALNVNCTVE